jgi:hypothetical protein
MNQKVPVNHRIDVPTLETLKSVAADYFDGNKSAALRFLIDYGAKRLREEQVSNIRNEWVIEQEEAS